jgi:hypothetical protein
MSRLVSSMQAAVGDRRTSVTMAALAVNSVLRIPPMAPTIGFALRFRSPAKRAAAILDGDGARAFSVCGHFLGRAVKLKEQRVALHIVSGKRSIDGGNGRRVEILRAR